MAALSRIRHPGSGRDLIAGGHVQNVEVGDDGVVHYQFLLRPEDSGELVKEALRLNAAAVIVSHNHPSGNPEPSGADKVLTQRLREALALVDVRTLDHIIVAGGSTISFAERGLI